MPNQIDAVLVDKRIPHTAKIVYVYLYRQWQLTGDVDDPYILISQKSISKELKVSKNTVCSAMAALRWRGYVTAQAEGVGIAKKYVLVGNVWDPW